MKLLAIILSSGLALAWGAGAMAAEGSAHHRSAKAKNAHHRMQHQRVARSDAPSSRGCGLRDHGRPDSSLKLSNSCDQEEFWRRMQDRAPGPE
jgi:TnpA family transposase